MRVSCTCIQVLKLLWIIWAVIISLITIFMMVHYVHNGPLNYHKQSSIRIYLPSFSSTNDLNHTISIDIPFIDIFEMDHNDASRSNHSNLPSLILLGPPKVGSRSFVDVLENTWTDFLSSAHERYFFNGPNKYQCTPNKQWTESHYTQWITDYTRNESHLYSFIPHIITPNTSQLECTKEGFALQWNMKWFEINKRRKINALNCAYPHAINASKNMCFFFDKSPNYSRHPFTAITMAHQLQTANTKYLIIIREPYSHSWSACWHFNRRICSNTRRLLGAFHAVKKSIHALNNVCNSINTSSDKTNEYKALIATYFYLRYVDPKNIEPRMRENAFIWVPFQLPSILIWWFAIEEYPSAYADRFRMIQFDFLWENVGESMNIIRCWITNECIKDYKMNPKWRAYKIPKNNTKSVGTASTKIQKMIRHYYRPCYLPLLQMIRDNPSLLLGRWLPWIVGPEQTTYP
eukprot:22464_1